MQVIKMILFFLAILGIASSLQFSSGSYEPIKQNNKTRTLRERKIQKRILEQINDFHIFVRDSLGPKTEKEDSNEEVLQKRFLKARLLYKKIEWAAEYFTGSLSQRVNGPPNQEVENADLMDPAMVYEINPTGLQVIETYLFPKYDKANREELIEEVAILEKSADYLQSYFTDNTLSDWRILDAAKLEIFRIITLGITGYDNPLTLHSMHESAMSLKSLREVLISYTNRKDTELIKTVETAINYLEDNTDFDSFNRAEFITEYANKISTGIAKLENDFSDGKKNYNRLLNQNAQTLFDPAAFNVNAFAPSSKYHLTDAKVQLGEALFFDQHLSGDGSRSCSTCHNADLGFTDGMVTNTNIYDRDKHLPRNTPTLLNAALQSNYFYDMRTLTLEDQALNVIQNKDEMHGNLEEIRAYLCQDSTYQKLFDKAFPSRTEKDIQPYQVANALASYVRSLTKLNSRFDHYMQGEKEAMTKEEIDGLNLFMGKAKCATCHFVPLFNGTTPPKYMTSETEVIGVPLSINDSIIDPDKGWYNIVGVDSYKYAFKTPTVRNIDQTAPYMHNGIYETLEEVMEFYNNAGAIGLGFGLENMTLPEDSLQLSDKEIDHIVKFMKSLKDL